MLLSIIAKYKFIIDKFFNFFLKKNSIGLRLIGYLDLWTENDKTEIKLLL